MYFFDEGNIATYAQNNSHSLQSFKSKFTEKENFNPIDINLELSDPTPSIHDLFVNFDKKFFWGELGMVQVTWSQRMTKCAGMCYFEGKYGLCKITLSAPLLSLRPRKDLVETLLHEMIHAFLFVTNNYKDRNDHGAEFHKHMSRINKEAGTNISVYHTFHDEVEYYQQYIWRCDGPCRFRKPYFGFVKRSVNRAPSSNDFWWSHHKNECGGTFIKVSEPDKKPKHVNKKRVKKSNQKNYKTKEIKFRNLKDMLVNLGGGKSDEFQQTDKKQEVFTDPCSNRNKSEFDSLQNQHINNLELQKFKEFGEDENLISTEIVVNSKTETHKIKLKNPELCTFIKNLNSDSAHDVINKTAEKETFNVAENNKDTNINTDSKCLEQKRREHVRNIWSKKFLRCSEMQEPNFKKIKVDDSVGMEDDIKKTSIYASSEKAENSDENKLYSHRKNDELKNCLVCNETVMPEKVQDHLESCLECFFKNKDFNINPESDSSSELVPCPCCYNWFVENEMNNHIDECLTIIALKNEVLPS